MASSSCLFAATVVLALTLIMAEASRPSYINYTTVTGYFLQDEPSTDPGTFDYVASNLGLIDRSYETDLKYDPDHEKTQWERFKQEVYRLNNCSRTNIRYKLLYVGRHGEGYHNVAEDFYGTPAWDCYWSKLDGNGTVIWDDARITENGVKQAEKAHAFWADRIATAKIPVPETYYTSPLTRCLETAQITFSNLDLPISHPFIPQVKEFLREAIGIHTCDRRRSKSYIQSTFPNYTFEPGFPEHDPLWKPDVRETDSAQEARLKELLDDIFTHDQSTFISLSSHSGSIGALLRALKHRPFRLVTGAVIPVLVRAERIYGEGPSTRIATSTSAPPCTVNPTASAVV